MLGFPQRNPVLPARNPRAAMGYAGVTVIGRLARYTDTLGAMGETAQIREDASGNVGVRVNPLAAAHFGSAAFAASPTLGSPTGAAAAFSGTDSAYGLGIWTHSNGKGSIQQQRFDGTGTAYDLVLQPSGGNLTIGGATALGKVTVTSTGNGRGLVLLAESTSAPNLEWVANTGAADAKIWRATTTGGAWQLQRVNDAYSATTDIMHVAAAGHVGLGTATPNKSSYGRAITLNAASGQIPVFEWAVNDVLYARQWGNSGGLYIDTIGSIPINYRPAGGTVAFSIGTAVVTASVAVALEQGSLALSNGANQNAARPAYSSIRITGPTGAFDIGGLTGGANGVQAELINTTSQVMTLNNEDAGSTAGNRILTPAGTNLVCKTATLRFDATAARWWVVSYTV